MWLETLLSKEVTSQRIEIVTLSCFEIVVCVSVCVRECVRTCAGAEMSIQWPPTVCAHSSCSSAYFCFAPPHDNVALSVFFIYLIFVPVLNVHHLKPAPPPPRHLSMSF